MQLDVRRSTGEGRARPRLADCARFFLALALWLTACDSTEERERGDAQNAPADAASEGRDAQSSKGDATIADTGMIPSASDAGAQDAGPKDAAPEAGQSDAGANDAGIAAPSRRAQVCGDARSWPAPLPADESQRTAQVVGSQTFGFLEGPVWIAEAGVLLFSDMDFSGGDAQGPPSRIRRLRPPADFDVFAASSNSNGLALTNEGAVLAATHDNQGLSLFPLANGARMPLTVRADGKHLNSPNDLTVRSDGTVYLTDPNWQLGQRSSETGITGAYRVAPPLDLSGTNQAILFEDMPYRPNGVALSPDERTLYLGSFENEIWRYDVASDGSLSGRSKFAETGGSDGMAVDCAGNLYVASGTIEVFAPDGTKLGDINVGADPTNAAFGGADRKTLYITAGARLYAIGLNVPGFPY